MNQRTSTVTENSGDNAQGGLFGVEEMTRSLLPEKAIVSDYVRKQLGAEKKLFGAVSTQAAADRLGEAGNVIQAGTNAQTAESANQGSLLYDKLSTKAGPIDGILDRGAQRLAKGKENANDVKQQAYREIRDQLKAQLDQLRGSGERAEGLRAERGGEAGPGELDRVDAGRTGVDDTGGAGAVRAGTVEQNPAGEELGPSPRYRPSFPAIPWENDAPNFLSRTAARVDADPNGEHHLYVNEPGAVLLHRVMAAAFPGEPMPARFDGTTLPVRRAERVLRILEDNARTARSEVRPAFRQLAEQLAAGLERTPEGVSVVHVDEARPESTVAATEGEEAFHRATLRATGGRDIAEEKARAFLGSNPSVKRAGEALRAMKPYLQSHAEAVEELAAMLRNGEWAKLELSDAQAKDAWYGFGRLMSNAYGEPGREILKYGHPEHADAAERVRREAGGTGGVSGQHPGPVGGTDEGTGPRYRFAVRRGSRGQPYQVPTALEAARGASGETEGGGRQAGLFDSDAERQSQVDAQRGADKLTHDQLTAQLKSGGQVRPSNLKPAENRGLFEEEKPESGNLFGGERGSLSLKSTKTPEQVQAARDKQYATNMREWFTKTRDPWGARVHQITARLRRDLPDHVDREGLYLMRDMRNHPGEMQQYLAGSHPAFQDVPPHLRSRLP
jgi:hypothetical protein